MATKTSQYDKLKNLYNSELTQAVKDNPAQNLWDSLSYGYGKKAEEIGQNYDKAIAQQGSSLLKRGMQRSSAGMQSISDLQNQRVKALGDNTDAMIADWQNRLQQQNEAQAARDFQAGEAEKQRAFTTSEREATQIYNTGEREAQQRYNTGEREAQQVWQSGENALNRAQDQAQFEANLGFQRERAAVSDDQWERQFNNANDQWKQQFDYNKMSDDQKLAYNYVTAIIGQGGTPSDDLLARAGLSRNDANAMTAQVTTGGGGGRRSNGGGDDDTTGGGDSWADSLFATNASNTISSAAQIVANATKPYTPYGEWKTNQEKKKNG
jgi:hypothetical protein